MDNDTFKGKLTGAFANQTGPGYSPVVGYGLIDAAAALQKFQGAP